MPVDLTADQKVENLSNDPEFYRLSGYGQRRVWSLADPEFSQLSIESQERVISLARDRFQKKQGEQQRVETLKKQYANDPEQLKRVLTGPRPEYADPRASARPALMAPTAMRQPSIPSGPPPASGVTPSAEIPAYGVPPGPAGAGFHTAPVTPQERQAIKERFQEPVKPEEIEKIPGLRPQDMELPSGQGRGTIGDEPVEPFGPLSGITRRQAATISRAALKTITDWESPYMQILSRVGVPEAAAEEAFTKLLGEETARGRQAARLITQAIDLERQNEREAASIIWNRLDAMFGDAPAAARRLKQLKFTVQTMRAVSGATAAAFSADYFKRGYDDWQKGNHTEAAADFLGGIGSAAFAAITGKRLYDTERFFRPGKSPSAPAETPEQKGLPAGPPSAGPAPESRIPTEPPPTPTEAAPDLAAERRRITSQLGVGEIKDQIAKAQAIAAKAQTDLDAATAAGDKDAIARHRTTLQAAKEVEASLAAPKRTRKKGEKPKTTPAPPATTPSAAQEPPQIQTQPSAPTPEAPQTSGEAPGAIPTEPPPSVEVPHETPAPIERRGKGRPDIQGMATPDLQVFVTGLAAKKRDTAEGLTPREEAMLSQGQAELDKRQAAEPPFVPAPEGSTKPEAPTPHKFSNTQLDLPEGTTAPLLAKIDQADLGGEGIVKDPHVTVKYGLSDETPDAVAELIKKKGPITLTLGKTKVFPPSKSSDGMDVVYVDVDSPELHALNKEIGDKFETADSHPEYKPHITLAYVKPGTGQKYAGLTDLEGKTVTIGDVTFSSKTGKTHSIKLEGGTKEKSAGSRESPLLWQDKNVPAYKENGQWYVRYSGDPPAWYRVTNKKTVSELEADFASGGLTETDSGPHTPTVPTPEPKPPSTSSAGRALEKKPAKPRKVLLREVKEAERDYANQMSQWGERNEATIHALGKWQDLRKAYEEQNPGPAAKKLQAELRKRIDNIEAEILANKSLPPWALLALQQDASGQSDEEYVHTLEKFIADYPPSSGTSALAATSRIPEGPPPSGIDMAKAEGGKVKLGADPEALGMVLGSSLYSKRSSGVIAKELLQNAYDAIRGVPNGKVEVSTGATDDYSHNYIKVQDNGPGMTREELETVFTNLGSSGKRGQSEASGGFGIAKAAPLLMGDRIKVSTVTKEGADDYVENYFEATPDQVLKTGFKINKRHLGDGPTGTKIEVLLPRDMNTWEAEHFFQKSIRSINPPGKFQYGTASDTERISGQIEPVQKMASAKIPGAMMDIHVSYGPKSIMQKMTGSIPLEIHNNGIYQFDQLYYPPQEVGGLPSRIVVDVRPTAKEGTADYPFLANRESLRDEALKGVNNAIKKEIIDPALKKFGENLSALYNNLPHLDREVTGNRSIPFLDSGKRLTPDELKELSSDPGFGQLARAISDAALKALRAISDPVAQKALEEAGLGNIGKRVERIGMVFSDAVYGVNIVNPSDRMRGSIFINPLLDIKKTKDPWQAAAALWQVVLHELIHDAVGGHYATFTTAEHNLHRILGRIHATAIEGLKNAVGADDDTIRPELDRALHLYALSRLRPETAPDILGGEELGAERREPPTGDEETTGRGLQTGGASHLSPADSLAEGPPLPRRPGDPMSREQAVEKRIRDIFPALLEKETRVGDAARLSDLKEALPEIPPAEIDRVLLQMQKRGEVSLQDIESPTQIKDRDRDAAIKILGDPRHIFYITKPSTTLYSGLPVDKMMNLLEKGKAEIQKVKEQAFVYGPALINIAKLMGDWYHSSLDIDRFLKYKPEFGDNVVSGLRRIAAAPTYARFYRPYWEVLGRGNKLSERERLLYGKWLMGIRKKDMVKRGIPATDIPDLTPEEQAEVEANRAIQFTHQFYVDNIYPMVEADHREAGVEHLSGADVYFPIVWRRTDETGETAYSPVLMPFGLPKTGFARKAMGQSPGPGWELTLDPFEAIDAAARRTAELAAKRSFKATLDRERKTFPAMGVVRLYHAINSQDAGEIGRAEKQLNLDQNEHDRISHLIQRGKTSPAEVAEALLKGPTVQVWFGSGREDIADVIHTNRTKIGLMKLGKAMREISRAGSPPEIAEREKAVAYQDFFDRYAEDLKYITKDPPAEIQHFVRASIGREYLDLIYPKWQIAADTVWKFIKGDARARAEIKDADVGKWIFSQVRNVTVGFRLASPSPIITHTNRLLGLTLAIVQQNQPNPVSKAIASIPVANRFFALHQIMGISKTPEGVVMAKRLAKIGALRPEALEKTSSDAFQKVFDAWDSALGRAGAGVAGGAVGGMAGGPLGIPAGALAGYVTPHIANKFVKIMQIPKEYVFGFAGLDMDARVYAGMFLDWWYRSHGGKPATDAELGTFVMQYYGNYIRGMQTAAIQFLRETGALVWASFHAGAIPTELAHAYGGSLRIPSRGGPPELPPPGGGGIPTDNPPSAGRAPGGGSAKQFNQTWWQRIQVAWLAIPSSLLALYAANWAMNHLWPHEYEEGQRDLLHIPMGDGSEVTMPFSAVTPEAMRPYRIVGAEAIAEKAMSLSNDPDEYLSAVSRSWMNFALQESFQSPVWKPAFIAAFGQEPYLREGGTLGSAGVDRTKMWPLNNIQAAIINTWPLLQSIFGSHGYGKFHDSWMQMVLDQFAGSGRLVDMQENERATMAARIGAADTMGEDVAKHVFHLPDTERRDFYEKTLSHIRPEVKPYFSRAFAHKLGGAFYGEFDDSGDVDTKLSSNQSYNLYRQLKQYVDADKAIQNDKSLTQWKKRAKWIANDEQMAVVVKDFFDSLPQSPAPPESGVVDAIENAFHHTMKSLGMGPPEGRL